MLPFKKSLLNSICDFQTFVKLSSLQRLKSQISQEIRKWLKCLSHSHHNSFFHQASDLDMWLALQVDQNWIVYDLYTTKASWASLSNLQMFPFAL